MESSHHNKIPGANFWAALSAQTKSCHQAESGNVQAWLPENLSQSLGEPSMLETSDSPRTGSESTLLSQILENLEDWLEQNPGSTPKDFYQYLGKFALSSLAATGILRRSKARGKKLHPTLELALNSLQNSPTPSDKDTEPEETELMA